MKKILILIFLMAVAAASVKAQVPDISCSSTAPVFEGATVVLTTTATGTSYRWQEVNSGTVTTTTVTSFNVTAPGTYTYRVRVQSGGVWSGWSSPVSFEIYPTPSIDVNATSVCEGTTIVLTTNATGAQYKEYQWQNYITTQWASTNVPLLDTVISPGTYTFRVRVRIDPLQWSGWSSPVSFEIYPTPAKPVINPVADVCFGETLTLETAAGFTRYSWRETNSGTVTTGTDNTLSLLAAGTYSYQVRVRNADNCWSPWSDVLNVKIYDLPAKPAIAPVTNVCFGETLTFTAPSGFVSYEWVSGNGTSDISINNTKSVTAAGIHSYRVRVRDGISGCWSEYSDVVNGEIYPVPAKPVINPVADVCFGETLTLETAAGFARYNWRETTSLTVTNTTVNTLSLTATGAYAYQVRVRDAHNCWSSWSDIVNVKINDLPAKPVINSVSNVCSGETLTFTATAGFAQYEWTETGSGINDISATNTKSQTVAGIYTYKVRVQDANGCWSDYSDEVSGEIYALPAKPVINPVSDVCFEETLTFETASGFARYRWQETNSGATVTGTDSTISQTATGAYSYRVRVQDVNGCWSPWSDVVSAMVNPKPETPVIGKVSNVCFGETIKFEAIPSNYSTYEWTETISGTIEVSGSVKEVSDTGAYSYIVRIQNEAGCWSDYSNEVSGEIYPVPAKPVINPVSDVCFGETLTFETAAGFARYSWRETNSGATVTGTDSTISQTATGIYSYRVRVRNEYGCWSPWSDVVSATVNPKPETPVIGKVSNVCFGETIKFEVIPSTYEEVPSTYSIYEWTETISGTIELAGSVKEVSDTGAYSYIVRVQNEAGCWSEYSDEVSGEIYPVPAKPVINPVSDVCFEETLTFETAAGFARYSWRETNSGATVTGTDSTISQTAIGIYSYRVRVRNEYGCWSEWSDVVSATVNPKPEKPVINPVEDVCFSETLTFETVAGYPRYRWRINGVATTGTNNTVSETAVGTYTYQVRVRNAEGCWSDWSDAVTATVKPKPEIVEITTADVCFGETLIFETAAGFARYRWQETISGYIHTGKENTVSQTAVGTYTYRVQVRNDEGCWSDYSSEVTGYVHPLPDRPSIEPAGTVAICENSSITLTATSGLAKYTWYLNGNEIGSGVSNTYTATQAGNYTVKVETVYGCESDISDATTVEVIQYPELPVITAAGMENSLVWRKTGMGIVFEVVNRLDTLVYQWYHNGSAISGGQGEALHLTGLLMTDAGLYSVTATTQKAQCSTMSDNVELIMREEVYIHNLITPNNDGQNDNLRIRGLEIYPHSELIIVNRWGNQVFNAKDYLNGTWNGANLPDGVYFYKLKLIEFNGYTEEKTGYFHLKR